MRSQAKVGKNRPEPYPEAVMRPRLVLFAAAAAIALPITLLNSPAKAEPLCYLIDGQGQTINLTALCGRTSPAPAPTTTARPSARPSAPTGSIANQWLALIDGQPGANVLRQSWASGGAINPDRALDIYCRNLASGLTPQDIQRQDAQIIVQSGISGLALEAARTNIAAIAILARTNC